MSSEKSRNPRITTTQAGVEALRQRLGITQIELAKAVGTTQRTIARYESDSPPGGSLLSKFEALARARGFGDLGDFFALQAKRLNLPATRHAASVEPGDDAERLWCGALLRLLRDPDKIHAARRERILHELKPVAEECVGYLQAHDKQLENSSTAAVLLRKGTSAAEVARLLDLEVSEVERFHAWIKATDLLKGISPKGKQQ